MIHELHELLARAGARMRNVRLWSSLAVCWLFWAAVVWGVAQVARPGDRHWPAVWSLLGASTLLTALVCWVVVRRVGRDPRNTARRIEATHPELGAMLLAAIETAPVPKFKRLGYLQAAVVQGAVSHGRQHDWASATSRSRLLLAKTAHFASLAALASACLLLADRTAARGNIGGPQKSGDQIVPGAPFEVEIQPGNAEIERGTTLLVLARFQGALPPDAELVVRETTATSPSATPDISGGLKDADVSATKRPTSGRSVRPMARSLDDPQFVGRVPGVAGPLSYHVEFAGQHSPTYQINVFDYPELSRADAQLDYPDYTRLDDKIIEDVRRVTAVEGTQLTLRFRLNKDVKDARLVDRDGEEIVLKRAAGAEPSYETSYKLARSQRFKLHLLDAEDRRNKLPPDITVNVTPNKPVEIKITKPARDTRVSPLEELRLAGSVSDDFAVAAFGVSYAIGGDEPTDVALGGSALPEPEVNSAVDLRDPTKKASVEHLMDFEALQAEPDQLVSYFVWAEDIGPDGQRRRTLSDMYFAEVRHFDEIFRQGEQPTEQQQREQQQQQQAGAGQQAEELAEIQKQVVSATWKLLRRETQAQPTAEFTADATAVKDGQQQALDKLAELAEQLSDTQSSGFAADARRHMESALAGLTSAVDASDPKSLRPALSAEQAAYQALLKLRAREFNVTRSNQRQQGQPGAAGGSASQQQLQQLELSAEENRYETQSRAAAANRENAEQLEESRQVLNRLSELARRQEDLNERLRELQSALEEAETAEEREELERQLKRLRDQQREILRDAEQLDNDMQSADNAQEMQDAAEQLGETRSRVQDASEALDEGQVSQALTEGARAERELSELRDDFRRRTADRFTEEMRTLRHAAEQLDERQNLLSQQLDAMNSEGRRTLRDAGPREEFLRGLGEQKRELEQTLDTMRKTVAEAEEPEPLLARQLYDAVQNAADQRTGEALETTRELTEAGVAAEASEAMRQADRGIDQLREQIDRAAESVLGDETEALRRANDRLQELSEALNQEIAQASGQRGPSGGPSEPQGPSPRSRNGERGAQAGQAREGQQPGEGEPTGETDDGDRGLGAGQSASEEAPDESRDDRAPSERPGPGRGEGQGQALGSESQSQDPQARGGRGQGRQSDGQPEQQQGDAAQSPGRRQDDAQRGGQQSADSQQTGEDEQGLGEAGERQDRGGQPGNQPRESGNGRPGNAAEDPAQGSSQGSPAADGQRRQGDLTRGGNPTPRAGGSRNNGGGGGRGGADDLGAFQDAFSGAEAQQRGPITGDDFRNWSEGMREVEDMLGDPELAAEAARIRDRAEQARVDFVRRAKTPDWDKVVEIVADPLVQLQTRIQEEIRRQESPDALAPIERDAAPAEFADEVRMYYQRLGSGE